MTSVISCARALAGGEERRNFAFAIEDGTIAAAGDCAEVLARYPYAARTSYGEDVAILPGFVNGHSHAYQILLRGWADDLPFERWRSEALYRAVPALTPQNVYDVFLAAFEEMLAAGITTVAEFFYLNGAGNAHAEAAIAAARAAGIRLIFARTWMDAPSAPPAFRESIDEAAFRTAELMRAFPDANVCVAPHSLHACSAEMISAAAQFAKDAGCMLHIHVAEAQYERESVIRRFGAGPMNVLDRLGALNERTVAVHAIHISEEEKQITADRGARVVHNPVTNQYLGDGICDVVSLRTLGVPVGLGTDADVKPSILDEMRAAALLQKLKRNDGSALNAATAFSLGTAEGASALGLDRAGDLRPGSYADYCVMDVCGVDPWTPLINAVVYRAESAWIKETFVGGRRVARQEDRRRADTSHLSVLIPQGGNE
ncbi:MAG: amidohydrolase family protein [Candidatus Eremiobacteraeota bacterium]|nr:amidohydrolase family protein [Candidatus Eremiobacteraeota bacterium]